MGREGRGHQLDIDFLLTQGGSRLTSSMSSLARACSLLCPYLLEEVRTRVRMDDEEVWAAGRTYRTPRRLLVPSAALVEGRAPVLAPNSPGGGGGGHPILSLVPVSPLPNGLIPVPRYHPVGSGGYKAAVRSRPPGSLPPLSAMEAPEVRWQ